jgi:hypothetical protein
MDFEILKVKVPVGSPPNTSISARGYRMPVYRRW